jgi:hypothetical protein
MAADAGAKVLLRNLPVAVGVLGSGLLVLNRLLTADPTPAQTRSDSLGVALSAVLILVGLLWQQARPAQPEETPLAGGERFEVAPAARALHAELRLLRDCLLGHTRARTLLFWRRGETLLRAGIFEGEVAFAPGPIALRTLQTGRPVYLVDLRLFPGRIEFAALPSGLRALVCQPVGADGLLVVGAAAPRSFTPQELGWIAALADHLGALAGENA